ncbi:oxidoreductase [Dictyobacter arantiisoli]|uniref:Oxidoreductase n=1 Tax=Dictyobacter arantiisoli TaxID=2014874 RepID=A0A5A5TC47_9CHLR|nr:NADH:flavin oxidoreductase/NADH oxidase [Dictyobacter arantiisoli]GCF09080.1 oxidoreductase [Dictyobacter arantiisoli]
MSTLPTGATQTAVTGKQKHSGIVKLFEPYTLRNLTFKNRIAVAPMCQYSAEDGFAQDWHLVHLGALAVGGAGLVITEATAVEARGRISPQDLGIYRDEHIEMLSRIASFIKAQGAVAGMQLAHAGRKGSTHRPWDEPGDGEVKPEDGGWQTVAPSAIAFADTYPQPEALSVAEIAEVVKNFQCGAQRALKAGFQVLEIHAAHGYLIHQFLSPYSNHRTDEYGGSLQNRMRFLLEVTDAIREVVPAELPLFVRISATDWLEEGGLTLEESVEVAQALKEHGVDLIDVSTGGNVKQAKIPVGPGYQVPFSDTIHHEAQIPTGAVGMITEPTQANNILEQDKADMIFLARELLRDTHWPLRAAHELGSDIAWPKQYERAKR